MNKPVHLDSIGIDDPHVQWNTAIQAVRRAGHSGVIGPDGHLHLVKQSLIIDAPSDQ
jgi:hypothetical protein